MKRLALLSMLAVTGCTQYASDWVTYSARELVVMSHRRHVNQELRAIREAQARPRVVVVRQAPEHEAGRRLGIELAAKAAGGRDVSAERARFQALDADEQEACVASYTRHAPTGEAGRTVLEQLWLDRN